MFRNSATNCFVRELEKVVKDSQLRTKACDTAIEFRTLPSEILSPKWWSYSPEKKVEAKESSWHVAGGASDSSATRPATPATPSHRGPMVGVAGLAGRAGRAPPARPWAPCNMERGRVSDRVVYSSSKK